MPTDAGFRMLVLLADDSALMRAGFRSVLDTLGTNLEVLEAGSLEEAEGVARGEPAPDLVLIDLALPGLGGAEGLKRFSARCPRLKIAATAAEPERGDMVRAFDAGAIAYLPKSLPVSQLRNILKLVFEGGSYAPADILLAQLRAPASRCAYASGRENPFARLTARQRDVLELLAQGLPNRDIARALGLSEATVKVHVNRILKALNVRNRSQAALAASRAPETERG